MLDVNLKGAFLTMKAVTRGMMKRRVRAGSSTSRASSGWSGNKGQANYAASKAGLIGLTKAVAKELASRNVRVQRGGAGLHRDGHDRGAAAPRRGRR